MYSFSGFLSQALLNTSSKTAPRDKLKRRDSNFFFTIRVNPSKCGFWASDSLDEGKEAIFCPTRVNPPKRMKAISIYWRALKANENCDVLLIHTIGWSKVAASVTGYQTHNLKPLALLPYHCASMSLVTKWQIQFFCIHFTKYYNEYLRP